MKELHPYSRVSEKAFQAQVIELARYTGHSVFHTYDSRRSEPGFPDLVIAKPGLWRPLFVELKKDGGKLSKDQKRWRDVLLKCPGADYRLWYPSDFDEIVATLSGKGSEVTDGN